MKKFQKEASTYNALEKDIAVLNVYFGKSTIRGIMYLTQGMGECDIFLYDMIHFFNKMRQRQQELGIFQQNLDKTKSIYTFDIQTRTSVLN